MDKVVNKILDYNSDQAIREQLRAEEEWRRGYNSDMAASKEEGKLEGIAEGIEKGRFEEKKKTAKKMKADGLSSEMISKYTGLSLEEISKL